MYEVTQRAGNSDSGQLGPRVPLPQLLLFAFLGIKELVNVDLGWGGGEKQMGSEQERSGGSGQGLGWNPCSRAHSSLQRGVRHRCNPQKSLTVGAPHLDDNSGNY